MPEATINHTEQSNESDISDISVTVCVTCGQQLNMGDWPYCPHGSTRPEWAQHFQPIIVDRDPSTGQISYPGSSHDPVPSGYERVTMTTIQQADRFCSERTEEESLKRRGQIMAEKEYFDAKVKDRREGIRNIIKQRGFSGKYFDMISERMDKRRDKKYEEMLRRPVNFFNDVFAFDSSNREQHSDERTGWKSRKG